MKISFDPSLDPFARGYLTQKAQQLDACVPCTPCGRDDYLQDLQLDLIRRRARFDPRRSRWTSFVRLVVDHRSAELRRRCLTGRCHAQRSAALSPEWGGSDPAPSLTVEQRERSIDVAESIGHLRSEDQQLCHLLMCNSVSAAAAELGLSRNQIQHRITSIRTRFQDAGLAIYLPNTKKVR